MCLLVKAGRDSLCVKFLIRLWTQILLEVYLLNYSPNYTVS